MCKYNKIAFNNMIIMNNDTYNINISKNVFILLYYTTLMYKDIIIYNH